MTENTTTFAITLPDEQLRVIADRGPYEVASGGGSLRDRNGAAVAMFLVPVFAGGLGSDWAHAVAAALNRIHVAAR